MNRRYRHYDTCPVSLRLRDSRSCRAFTLIELVVSLAILSILMAATGSVMMLAAKSIPANYNSTTNTSQITMVLSRLETELMYATRVTIALPGEIVFEVSDQDRKGKVVPIRISFVKGSIVRSYNMGAETVLVSNISSMTFTYNTKSEFYTSIDVTVQELSRAASPILWGIPIFNQVKIVP